MENKHELTERLKLLEVEIHNQKIELKSINSKLEIAYSYEDELAQRSAAAKKQTTELRTQFFTKSSEISEKYREMKAIFDVWTGNFYREVLP